MSGSINKVTLMGHVGKDPIIQNFQDGNKMARFSVCTTEKWTNKKTNEKMVQTEWHNIVVHNQTAIPYLEKWVRKGAHLYIEGMLKSRTYTDKNEIERTVQEVVVKGFNHCIMTVSFPRGEDESSHPTASQDTSFELNDDVPF